MLVDNTNMNLPHHRKYIRGIPFYPPSSTRIAQFTMTQTHWEILKWTGTTLLLLATLVMLSPTVASTAVTPWVIFLASNAIWFADSVHVKSWPWATVALMLGLWDTLIIISRLTGAQFLSILDPFIVMLNVLP